MTAGALLAGCSDAGSDGAAPPASTTSGAAASSTVAGPGASVAELTAASDKLITSALDADRPGCSAAVGVEGIVVWRGTRGLADVATGTSITPDTVFDIGSVTKQFTAAAVLLLAQDGVLALTDPVSKYVDGLPAWGEEVTLTSMMHNTSGVPDLAELAERAGVTADRPASQQDVVALVASAPALTARRGSFEYSNSNFLLLAEVVRTASGRDLPQFLHERVFAPLDLTMVVSHVAAVPGKATSYSRAATGAMAFTALVPTPLDMVGPGGIQTTPSELVRWADNYRTGAVGGAELLRAQLAEPVKADFDEYGAGIFVDDGVLMHTGGWDGFFTEFFVSEDRRTSVAVACNAILPRSLGESLLELWT
jgi:CubicO group peptidase (beta-lactamase class C family)